ncbi:MAG TPA: alkaline phosphatase PhoX [Ideonella sp.]|uniref:PhoX family protein n=1 Tax=Ideonella sp. TaxID=1929293 RepID=UPI002CBCEF19|nr:alkaline phosphatase PhoX [Ideonella sp.]HSI50378.1 alkaline phosphatase PhoX [Ideonella sp.]
MTSSTFQPSRRSLVKMLAGVPLLPLGSALASAGLLSACDDSNDGDSPAATLTGVSFSSMAAPSLATAAAMATTTVGSTLVASFDDQSTQSFTLGYQPFFITGTAVPNGAGGTVVAGGYYDIDNQPIVDGSVPGAERQFFSDCPDGTSLLTVSGASVAGVKGNTVFAVVQFEYATRNQAQASMYGLLPSPIAVLTLDQDKDTGKLSLVKYHNVDTSGVKGLWITCGASLSPWGTHLSSEEYEPDAFDQGALGQSLSVLHGYSQNVFGDTTTANPYDYGHLPEVTVNADGTGTIQKHYGLGRISHELIQVMPDNRTALMGDDATNGALFMFVADKEKDLSAGTLYVAKYTSELNATASGSISWIKLGATTSAEVKALVDGGIVATDIMDSVTTDPADGSYTQIVLNKKTLWVRVKPGQEKAAAFLETHRYAALKGGSMAFTKMEGTTVNVKDKKAYSAISAIKDSMVSGKTGFVAAHNVVFPAAINSGGVLEHTLAAGLKDSDGNAINSEWVPASSQFILLGEDLATADALGNLANADKIGNPDNLKFSEAMRTLFIGEDSGMHVNNFLWAYNVDSKQLSRVLSCPSGAESTGLQAVDEINGWTYVMSNFQHPGDWETPLHDIVKPTLDPLVRANYDDRFGAAVGYVTATSTQIKLEA